jgi:hypothetical protein
MAQGGTRKIVVLPPTALTINDVRYEEKLIIGGCLFLRNPLPQTSHSQPEVKVVSTDWTHS